MEKSARASTYLVRYSNKVLLVQLQPTASNDVSIRFSRTNMDRPVDSSKVDGNRHETGALYT